ncbi:MAG: hypothetical protein MUD08_08230 [Cytophagales bacterium]|jgi:hypothetical protein|nr:hypothetical protein [Cytophagales bacterium]
MKKTIAIFALLFIGVLKAFANGDEKYAQAMQSALGQMKAAASPEQMQAVANRFEMIGKTASNEWLPSYYAAFCYANLSYMEKDSRKRDQYVEKAQSLIDATMTENDEIFVMKAYVAQANLAIDGQNRWETQGKIFEENLAKAEKLNAQNPRIDMLRGVSLLFTPEPFGGGAKNACPLLRKAQAQFEAFRPASALAPNWGKEDLEQYLAKCK